MVLRYCFLFLFWRCWTELGEVHLLNPSPFSLGKLSIHLRNRIVIASNRYFTTMQRREKKHNSTRKKRIRRWRINNNSVLILYPGYLFDICTSTFFFSIMNIDRKLKTTEKKPTHFLTIVKQWLFIRNIFISRKCTFRIFTIDKPRRMRHKQAYMQWSVAIWVSLKQKKLHIDYIFQFDGGTEGAQLCNVVSQISFRCSIVRSGCSLLYA